MGVTQTVEYRACPSCGLPTWPSPYPDDQCNACFRAAIDAAGEEDEEESDDVSETQGQMTDEQLEVSGGQFLERVLRSPDVQRYLSRLLGLYAEHYEGERHPLGPAGYQGHAYHEGVLSGINETKYDVHDALLEALQVVVDHEGRVGGDPGPDWLTGAVPQVDQESEYCEACQVSPVPGALFIGPDDGDPDLDYVSRCDECKIFETDEDAAEALAKALNRAYREDDEGYPYLLKEGEID